MTRNYEVAGFISTGCRNGPAVLRRKPIEKKPLKRGITGILRKRALIMLMPRPNVELEDPSGYAGSASEAVMMKGPGVGGFLDVRIPPWADTSSKWIGRTEALTAFSANLGFGSLPLPTKSQWLALMP